jgi:hypothetical protein
MGTMPPLVAIEPNAASRIADRQHLGRLPIGVALPILGLLSAGMWYAIIEAVRFLVNL